MGYEDALRGLVSGARRTSPNWPLFMADVVYGSLAERIADVFRATGTVPTRSQYERALAEEEASEPEPAPEPEPQPEPEKPKRAKAEKAEKPAEAAVEAPVAEAAPTDDEGDK